MRRLTRPYVDKKMMPLEIESFIIEIILLETSKRAGNLNEISTAISEKLKKKYGGIWSAVILKSLKGSFSLPLPSKAQRLLLPPFSGGVGCCSGCLELRFLIFFGKAKF